MASKDEFAAHRRKLSRRKREPGMINLPDRFKHDEDDDDEEKDAGEADARPSMPFMHQSVFGVIAAAQSKEDFKSLLEEHGSEYETDEEPDAAAPVTVTVTAGPASPSLLSEASPPPTTSKAKGKKRLSEFKLVKSLSNLGTRHSRSKSREERTPSLPTATPPQEQETHKDAPIMSQMLQARATAESLESSNSTLTARPSLPASASASTASLKSSRKAPLALPDALKDIFQFDKPEEVISEYPCWYLANVLLQGYMYITQRHVCFYAYLQQKTNTTIKSGHISKRGKTNPHYRRYWFVLKGTVFSYYVDPSAPYYPSGNIDLRYGISAELEHTKDKTKDSTFFSVTTDKRSYHFKADSAPSAKEWVKQLQKVIFRSHNDGDSVKISLPIDNILDVEENPIIDFAETIKIRVIDNDETFAVDEYFFSFFSFGRDALNVLKIMTQDTTAAKALAVHEPVPKVPVLASKKSLAEVEGRPSITLTAPEIFESVRATLPPAHTAATSSRKSLDVGGRPSVDALRMAADRPPRGSFDKSRRSTSAASRVSFDNFSGRSRSPMSEHTVKSPATSSIADLGTPLALTTSPQDIQEINTIGSQILSGSGVFNQSTLAASSHRRALGTPRLASSAEVSSTESSRSTSRERFKDKSPVSPRSHPQAWPSASANASKPASPRPDMPPTRSSTYTEQIGGFMRAGNFPIPKPQDIAGLLRHQTRRMSTLLGSSPRGYYEKVYGMWAGGKKHYADVDGLHGEDYVHDPDEDSDTLQAEARFRDYFALPDSEKLVASYFAHLLRVLPLYGKVYVGSTKLCFRSLLPGTRTKLIIPFKDILNVDKEKGFRFGYSGMVVVIRGHEEVFFEFNTAGLRDDCTVTVLKSLEAIKDASGVVTEEERAEAELAAKENTLLQEARQDGYAEHDLQLPHDVNELERGAPPILFDDGQASMLDFKPVEPLNITCLTIGSRGDVQPYIALCKGFLEEGHKVKIATHAEFEPWIRKHGIDFAPVEGDPAELMRICVENGMFTPSFLVEANSMFRGFLDALLNTAWTACQGSDLLIESPSAMAGIHIAEALGIPYFRAFTMPWTRTRAYPHAFAVPNHKMGGAYNYMTYVLFDNVFWQSTAGQVNRWRRKTLGLRPTTLDKLQPNKVPFMYNFSPSVVVPPLDFSDWIRVTGYWFLDEASNWTPPEDLVQFIAKAREDKMPLVYIGFGSVVVSDSRALTEAIVKAVRKADVRCILSKGWSDRLETAAAANTALTPLPDGSAAPAAAVAATTTPLPDPVLPPEIFRIRSAPHDWLFAQIDCAVHHGGAGTTGASLRAGIPTIIKPFFGDQFFFGARVQDLGVGMCIRKVSEGVLGKALWIATHDARMRAKAKILGEQIRAEDGVGNAVKAVYRDLEYARTLVRRRRIKADASLKEGSRAAPVAAGESADEALAEGGLEMAALQSGGNAGAVAGGVGSPAQPGEDDQGDTAESWTLVDDSEEGSEQQHRRAT